MKYGHRYPASSQDTYVLTPFRRADVSMYSPIAISSGYSPLIVQAILAYPVSRPIFPRADYILLGFTLSSPMMTATL